MSYFDGVISRPLTLDQFHDGITNLFFNSTCHCYALLLFDGTVRSKSQGQFVNLTRPSIRSRLSLSSDTTYLFLQWYYSAFVALYNWIHQVHILRQPIALSPFRALRCILKLLYTYIYTNKRDATTLYNWTGLIKDEQAVKRNYHKTRTTSKINLMSLIDLHIENAVLRVSQECSESTLKK